MEPASSSSEPKHSYSWRRDSHIVPKNSRWLQENLTDMDNKIKSMIKVIEEDADSFARRAEMYYKKRPELMKLVEEFYRAYRALAERYDRVTGALRQAHRTIAEAFPNQIQLVLPDEPPSELPDSGEEEKVAFSMPSYSDGNEENDLFRDLTEFADSFLNKNLNLKEDMGKDSELIKLQDEVSKLSKENKSLMNQKDKAETESKSFKDAVSKLKSEVESSFLQYHVSQKRVSYLEAEISQNREEVRNLTDEMSVKVSKLNIAEQLCLDLGIENRSLRLEQQKLNEEVSDLFKENQSLHNTVKSESMRADQAEAETCGLRDAVSKLKSEMEAEISRAGDQFQKFNKELYIRSSKLNSSEEQCLLLLEENKSLQFTLDKFKMRVAKQEEDIITREEQLSKLKQFMEDEHQQFKCARVKENISLQLDLNKFKLRNLTQEEELAAREKELDRLIQSLVDERQRRMTAEMAHESMKKLYSQSEEKARLLGLEIQSGTESLRRMEEEIKHLYVENHDLNEKRFSSVSKIAGLQDELKFHVVENKVLRQELSSLKNGRNDLEDRHLELTAQIGEVNFNVVSLREFVKDFLEEKKELKDACKKHEDEEAFRLMENISEKNIFLENSLSDVTAELELLREKIKGLEKCCESLHNNAPRHEEGKHVNAEKEKNLALHQLEELKALFGSEKKEHENHISALNNQMHLLKEENDEEEERKTAKSDIECFIMHKALYDIAEKNLILSDECQKIMEKLRCAEKLTLELKQGQSMHNKKLASLLDHNKKLLEWLHVMGKEDGETSNVVNEDIKQLNPQKIVDPPAPNEEMHQLYLEKSAFASLSCVFRSSNAEKSSQVDQLIGDIHHLHGITDELRQNIGEINENLRVLQSDNMNLRDLVVNLETRNPVAFKDIDAFPELKPQIDAGKNQLEQRDMERFKEAELLVKLEGVVVELNKANAVKEGLEKNILSLCKDIVCKNDEIEILHQSNDKLVQEYSKLHKETEAMRSREKNLASEIQREKDESRRCEEECAAYLIEIHAALVNELILRQVVAELMMKFDMPNGVISVRNSCSKELMSDLSAHVPLAVSSDNDILRSKTKQHKKLSQVRAKDHSSKVSAGILELKRLHAKVKVLQKAVTDTEELLAQEDIVTDTNVDSETKNCRVRRSKGQLETMKKKDIISDMRKSNAAGKNFKLLKDDQEVSKTKHGQMMKDIQLDHVLSHSRHGGDCSAETDEQSHEACEPASGNDIEYHQIEIMEEERSEKPSSEVVLVKELSVDKIELPVNDTESNQEWCRSVTEALSSDARRLSILQKSLEKLKKSIRVSEMSNQPSISQLKSVSEQLKESEGVIMQFIDINFTLAKIADSFSASQGGNEGRRQIWERVRKASEKIGGVEVDLQNMQCILSKLLEDEESKKAKALKDLICSKRNDVRQKKRRFCACLRLKTKGDY